MNHWSTSTVQRQSKQIVSSGEAAWKKTKTVKSYVNVIASFLLEWTRYYPPPLGIKKTKYKCILLCVVSGVHEQGIRCSSIKEMQFRSRKVRIEVWTVAASSVLTILDHYSILLFPKWNVKSKQEYILRRNLKLTFWTFWNIWLNAGRIFSWEIKVMDFSVTL